MAKELAFRVKTTEVDGYQLLEPDNVLARRVVTDTGTGSGVDMSALARAEKALADLSREFDGWMEQEVAKLISAHETLKAEGLDKTDLDAFYRAAHDVRGQSATFGYPMAGDLADNLCNYMDEAAPGGLSQEFIDVHVRAIAAILREKVRDREHPICREILDELLDVRKRLVPEKAPDPVDPFA